MLSYSVLTNETLMRVAMIILLILNIIYCNLRECNKGSYDRPCNGGLQEARQQLFLWWKKNRELAEAQRQLKLPEHLKTECPTRWGSRQAMIDRVLEQHKAIAQVLSSDRKLRHLTLSWQDIDVLDAINKSLSPLVEFTDTLSGEKYISVSLLKPTLLLFSNSILEVQEDNDTDLTKSIKQKIVDYLNDKYSDPATQELLDMASALDPSLKVQA